MTDAVNHPQHYNNHPSGIECLDVIRDMCCDASNATKYVWRRGDKGNLLQDLDKARFYLEDQMRWPATYRKHSVDTTRKLSTVARAEPDPHAATFYLAMADHRIGDALDAVEAMRATVAATFVDSVRAQQENLNVSRPVGSFIDGVIAVTPSHCTCGLRYDHDGDHAPVAADD